MLPPPQLPPLLAVAVVPTSSELLFSLAALSYFSPSSSWFLYAPRRGLLLDEVELFIIFLHQKLLSGIAL